MTYYKYAERDAESRVNWGDVSKKWSDAIITGEETRETKRQDIQTLTDQLTDSIINAPMGDNEGINGWYADYAETASEYLLDANRRLKAGNIKVRDYSTIMANITQGTERMTGLAKDFSDNYAIKMERLQNDESQQAEIKMMELAEGFANFTNTTAIVNPTNGMLNIAKKDTGETVTIPQMRSYITMQYDRYNVDEAMGTAVDQLAKIEKVIMDERGIKTRESVRQMEDWEKQKDRIIEAELADGLHVSSILTEEIGGHNIITKPYFDENGDLAVDTYDILFVLDPRQPSAGYRVPLYSLDLENMTEEELDMIFSADLTPEQRRTLIADAEYQKQDAKEWLEKDLMSRLDVVETARADTGGGRGPTDAQTKRQGVIDRTRTAANHWMNLAFATTPEQKTTSARALQGLKFEDEYGSRQTIVGVDPTFEDRVVLTLRDANGDETTVDRVYTDSPDAQQWVSQGNFFYEDPSVAEALVASAQRREEGPLYGDMTLGVRATGAALAEEVVDIIPFGEATIGTGRSAESAPVYFQENSDPGNAEPEAAKTTSAVKAALGAMGVDASNITQITEAASEQFANADFYNEQETIRFHIPGVTPESIFVPNNQAGINALADMMSMLPGLIKNREQLTVEQALEMFSSVPKFKDYNGAKFGEIMRTNFGVTEAPRSTSGGAPRPSAPRP